MCGKKEQNLLPVNMGCCWSKLFSLRIQSHRKYLNKIACICSSVGSENSPVDIGGSILELTKISLSWFLFVSSSSFRLRGRGSGAPLFSGRLISLLSWKALMCVVLTDVEPVAFPLFPLHGFPNFGRVFCLPEVRECWLLIYSSNFSKLAYNFYTYT